MTEYQSTETVPYAFYTWGGLDTHVKNSYHKYLLNHPMRIALLGSYSWIMEIIFSDRYANRNDFYRDTALFGTLPEIAFPSDSAWPFGNRLTNQETARAQLFSEYELFNDIQDNWDTNTLVHLGINKSLVV